MKKWIAFIISLLAIDQITKYIVTKTFTSVGDTIAVIPNFFHFTYVRNPGVVFGLGGNLNLSHLLFVFIALIASGFFFYMITKVDVNDKKYFWYVFGLSLLIAGAFGNVIDRIFQFDHEVVDFIDFRGIWNYVFNFADICLTCGIAIFAFDQFILEPKREQKNETE